MESSDSSDASSSEESSSDEDGDVKMVAVQLAKGKSLMVLVAHQPKYPSLCVMVYR
jgi:hypothetical protein